MTRSFLFSLLTLVVLVILLLVTSINVWQLNRTERRLIEIERRVLEIDRTLRERDLRSKLRIDRADGRHLRRSALGRDDCRPSESANLLELDPVPTLPQRPSRVARCISRWEATPKGLICLPNRVPTFPSFMSMSLRPRFIGREAILRKWMPELAYSMVTPDEGLTYIFKLRDDFVWQKPIVDDPEAFAWLEGEHTSRPTMSSSCWTWS